MNNEMIIEPTDEELFLLEEETPEEWDCDANDSVSLYFMEIYKTPLLTPEQELEISRRVKAGDKEARVELINANLRLVANIAWKYANLGLEIMDLIQEGNLGLMKATDRYDPDKGYRFTTYARWWIKQSISRALAKKSRTIRIPDYMHTIILKINTAKTSFKTIHGCDPTIKELSEITGIKEQYIKDALDALPNVSSLDETLKDDSDTAVGDLLPSSGPSPEDTVISDGLQESIVKALSKLTDQEKNVIILRNGLFNNDTHTLEQIGSIYGLTRERIRQIERKAYSKLKDSDLRDFLVS